MLLMPLAGAPLRSQIAKDGRARPSLQGRNREISVTSIDRPDVWASRAAASSLWTQSCAQALVPSVR